MQRLVLMFICLLVTTACNPAGSVTPAVTSTPEPTTTPTAIPTAVATQEVQPSLTVWWPDGLISATDTDLRLLDTQLSAFAEAEDGAVINLRLKRVRDTGGILSTMRAAREVAPGALPDLTLMRREDLLTAVQDNLLQPMEGEGAVAPAIIGDLYDAALELGQIEDRLYGIPYALEIDHVAYRPDAVDATAWRYDVLLNNQIGFVFPAARVSGGVNPLFLLQYIDAGGNIPTSGPMVVDAEALRNTLQFYEDAVENGIIDASVLEYTRPSDYRVALSSGEIESALVSSQLYLQLSREDNLNLTFAPVPTASGINTTTLNGWMWVSVRKDANRQALVASFINWMMNADRQSTYTLSLNLLPSQRTSLRGAYGDSYEELVSTMMNNARLPLPEAVGGTTARAMQTALTEVLRGEKTAAEATQDVIDQAAT